MADDVLKYRVKIFSILLLLQECCQLHLFHLGMDFVLMFPTRLVARVFPVGKATFPSAVGLVPCLQGWLYPSQGRGDVSWELQPHGSFVPGCVCFIAAFSTSELWKGHSGYFRVIWFLAVLYLWLGLYRGELGTFFLSLSTLSQWCTMSPSTVGS